VCVCVKTIGKPNATNSIRVKDGCFEPPVRHRGNLARAVMYISTAYMARFTCCSTAATVGSELRPWFARDMVQWHLDDPGAFIIFNFCLLVHAFQF
jgi:endonuclease I